MNVRVQQSYSVNDPLSNLTGLVAVLVMAGSLYISGKYCNDMTLNIPKLLTTD